MEKGSYLSRRTVGMGRDRPVMGAAAHRRGRKRAGLGRASPTIVAVLSAPSSRIAGIPSSVSAKPSVTTHTQHVTLLVRHAPASIHLAGETRGGNGKIGRMERIGERIAGGKGGGNRHRRVRGGIAHIYAAFGEPDSCSPSPA